MTSPPQLADVHNAAEVLEGVTLRTPLVPLYSDDAPLIQLKLENLQPTGSFKLRGVYYAASQLTQRERAKGLSTVSAGNTAQALAWTARAMGISARSIMPASAPKTKIDAVTRLGGEAILMGADAVFQFLKEQLWEHEPYSFIHPWTNGDVMIGHGTMGLEIFEDWPEVQTVYVPVGGGGLMGGVASTLKALRAETRVVAVEPGGCAAYHESRRLGHAASVECSTMCDGVAVPYLTQEVFNALDGIVDRALLVSETEVRDAVRRLAIGNKIIVEPSGALAVAAALSEPVEQRGRSVCLVTGGSIDMSTFLQIMT